MMYVRTGIVPSFNIGFLAKKRGIVVEGCGKILQFGALIHSVSTDCGTGIFPALSDYWECLNLPDLNTKNCFQHNL